MRESIKERRHRHMLVELERTALDLFAARGYDTVTVAEIAQEAGISIRTFFRYFSTKDDIILMSVRQPRDRLLRALTARPEGEDVVTALRRAFVTTTEVREEERAAVITRWTVVQEAPVLRARVQGELAAVDRELVEEVARRMGVEAADPAPWVLLLAMAAVAAWCFDEWVGGGGRVDLASLLEARFDVLLELRALEARRRGPNPPEVVPGRRRPRARSPSVARRVP